MLTERQKEKQKEHVDAFTFFRNRKATKTNQSFFYKIIENERNFHTSLKIKAKKI